MSDERKVRTVVQTAESLRPIVVLAAVYLVVMSAPRTLAQTIYPSKDGTLVDGGLYGPFDGSADDADWYFNESSYEGAITLSTSTRAADIEHRVVWEYDLSGVSFAPPVSATLNFTLRGAPILPFPDVDVHVYSYPADLVESLTDFEAGPTELQGSVTVIPCQDPTPYGLDVSGVVNVALLSGEDKAAFRFQVDPSTPNPANQAFIDAVETDPGTKPYLTVVEGVAIPGDVEPDGDVDLDDFGVFGPCMLGPDVPADPTCEPFRLDPDSDVDLGDLAIFQAYFTG